MPCAPVFGTRHFLAEILNHVDCQAQTLGANGFGALAIPGSPVSYLVTALLTLFIAIFGIRLMLGTTVSGRDLVSDILKVGIVLTLATSWPAWRVLGYNLVVNAPIEIAQSISAASGMPGGRRDLAARLDHADEAIVGLTVFGTGRLTGGISAGGEPANSFQGAALSDQSALGTGRLAFLSGVLTPLLVVKVSAGILLALAPLMAGLLLFRQTVGLFVGWLRGLGACGLGTIALSLLYGVELAVLEPWLANALAQRQSNILAPSAPTELLVITLTFAIVAMAMLGLFAKVAFFRSGFRPHATEVETPRASAASGLVIPASRTHELATTPSRALLVSQSVEASMRREVSSSFQQQSIDSTSQTDRRGVTERDSVSARARGLGNSHRRTYRRTSSASSRRDTAS